MFRHMQTDRPVRKRLTRAEAKARTRGLLLDAAAQTFARKGFAASSVEEIAEAAGFSIGALYSNFSGKEDLFLELAATYNSDRIAEAAKMLSGDGGDSGDGRDSGDRRLTPADMGRLLTAAADNDTDFALLQAEFWLYAARNPQALGAMAERMRQPRQSLETLIAGMLDRQRVPPEATAGAVATIVAALFDGLARQRRLDPAQVPDELFGLALRWLFTGIDSAGRAADG